MFVTVGAFEFALSKRHDRGMPLSVEYSNWACNQVIRNSTVDRGQFFHDLLKGYEKHGLCCDELMRYEEKFQNTQPSNAARRDADANLRLRPTTFSTSSFPAIAGSPKPWLDVV